MNKVHKICILMLICLAIAIQIDYITWQKVLIMADTAGYLRVANEILTSGKLYDPIRTPGYPLFLVLNYIFFGYQNFDAIVIVQSLLGISSIFLSYIITFKLTKSRLASLICAFHIAFNYQLIYFKSAILTETLSMFFVLLTVILFILTIEKHFSWHLTALVNILLLCLIFTRPIFLYVIIMFPLLSIFYFIKTREKFHIIIALILFVIILLLPIGIYSSYLKRSYGFGGLSTLSNVNVLGVILKHNIHQYAPEEYKEFTELLNMRQQQLTGKDRYNPFLYLPLIKDKIPQQSEVDFSYLMKFSIDCMKNAPFIFLQKTIAQIPEIFTKMHKPKQYETKGSIISTIGTKLYLSTVYKAFRKDIWIVLLIFSLFSLIFAFIRNDQQIFVPLVLPIFIWLHILSITFLTYSDYERMRMPVDALIIIFLIFGFAQLINTVVDFIPNIKKLVHK